MPRAVGTTYYINTELKSGAEYILDSWLTIKPPTFHLDSEYHVKLAISTSEKFEMFYGKVENVRALLPAQTF